MERSGKKKQVDDNINEHLIEKIDVLNSLTQNLQTTLSQLTKVIHGFEERLKSLEENIDEE